MVSPSAKPVGLSERYVSVAPRLQYVPRGEKPAVRDLYDDAAYRRILAKIEEADIPDDLREFLRLAAARHVVVNFESVAEFYAHAEPEVQRLFEDQALVVLDFGDALEKGYVRFVGRLNAIFAEEERSR